MLQNLNFGIYYDKLFKKEYLPTRIRYNQFFFYTAFFFGAYLVMSKKNAGSMFCKVEGDGELANRKYFTSDRACTNLLMRQMNKSAVSSHVAK